MRVSLRAAAVIAGASALIAAGAVAAPALAAPHPSHPSHRASPGMHGRWEQRGHLDHVFVIMMENTSYGDLLPSNPATPFIDSLASQYGLATDYYGVTHTSMPNYVAALSGNTWGSNSDDLAQIPSFNHENLADQLDAAHISWKGYMESMPSAGYTGDYGDCANGDTTCTATPSDTSSALYVRKHDPFMLFPDIYDNPARAANVVPLTQLSTDLADGQVPQFVWISPNVCNDMHGGPAQCPYASSPTDQNQIALYHDGDNFLKTWVTAITSSSAWTGNSAIFITWDEGSYADTAPYGPTDTSGCCDSPVLPASPVNPSSGSGGDIAGGSVYGGGHVPMIVVARHGARHATDPTPANHYSLLRTIEQNWNLGYLGNASDSVQVGTLDALLSPGGGHGYHEGH